MNAPAAPSRAVTVLVTRRVAPAAVAAFEAAMTGMIEAATRFPGHLGGQLVRPDAAGDSDEPLLYHVVFAFDNEANLAAWQASPERAHWLAQVAPHTIGEQEMRRVSGLDYWFAPAGSTTVLNAANEIAVWAFLRNRIGFLDMTAMVEKTMQKLPFIEKPSLQQYFDSDGEARNFAASLINL